MRHPRNVLEWRADPASGHSDAVLSAALNRCVILVCDEGYQSSLAAATLKDLGFENATDLIGGFQAWRAAGLTIVPAADRPLGFELKTHQARARGGRDDSLARPGGRSV